MPSGLIHESYRQAGRIVVFPLSVLIPILLSPLQLKTGGEMLIGVGIFLGYEIGKFVTPDWDCVTATVDESKMMNELPILGNFLFGISSTYGAFFKRKHRSKITHFPFVSTSIRYLFLFWWIWFEIYRSTQDWAWLIFIFIGSFIGTSLSDLIHWGLDNWYNPTGE